MLDLLDPAFTTEVQSRLRQGETWNVTVKVPGTVSYYNDTIEQRRDDAWYNATAEYWVVTNDEDSTVWKRFGRVSELQQTNLYNGWNVGMISNSGFHYARDQSWIIATVCPDTQDMSTNITIFASYAKFFMTRRLPCQALGRLQGLLTSSSVEIVAGILFSPSLLPSNCRSTTRSWLSSTGIPTPLSNSLISLVKRGKQSE